jgi:hypothetical protein
MGDDQNPEDLVLVRAMPGGPQKWILKESDRTEEKNVPHEVIEDIPEKRKRWARTPTEREP